MWPIILLFNDSVCETAPNPPSPLQAGYSCPSPPVHNSHHDKFNMGKKDAKRPRVVCCAIPVARAAGKILVITSRKRGDRWVFPKGGWESTDRTLEAAAQREAVEEAGVHGTISRFIITIPSSTATYHFYELDVTGLQEQWPEAHERRREWVDFAEAYRRCSWKPELAQALLMASFAPKR